ncbi:MAG: hypothetical protein ACYTBV_20315 [Planctomycetota bacterium]
MPSVISDSDGGIFCSSGVIWVEDDQFGGVEFFSRPLGLTESVSLFIRPSVCEIVLRLSHYTNRTY